MKYEDVIKLLEANGYREEPETDNKKPTIRHYQMKSNHISINSKRRHILFTMFFNEDGFNCFVFKTPSKGEHILLGKTHIETEVESLVKSTIL